MARPLALVYRGPASVPGCPEAVADLLARSSWNFEVSFVGPREFLPLTSNVLSQAALYAQPGGASLGWAYRRLRREAAAIRDFVHAGGRYLGFCLGGYLAGETPGFAILPGDTDQYVSSPGAGTTTEKDTVISVTWGGEEREVFFQDGPYFDLDPRRGPAYVLAVYDNGLPAAAVAPFGLGAVGVCGPHPEATADWFFDAGLPLPQRSAIDLGLDLIERTMLA
jgi:glutamine amidotransferase-like uncharacterized protein